MTIRGEYGDIVYVDEVQSIDQDIMDTVVFPIIADVYSKKHLWLIGTPNLYDNPQLQVRWNDWQEKSERSLDYGYLQMDCYTATEEGCMDAQWIADQKAIMTDDDFAMEYLARFPDTSLRFYPMSLLESLKSSASFYQNPVAGCEYVLAADWAKYQNCTELVVGELNGNERTLTYIQWMELDPRDGKISYDIQARLAKELFWRYKCIGFIPDTTSNQDMLIPLLQQDEKSVRGIPPQYFWGYDRDKTMEEQRLGYKATDISNWEMWRDHKDAMLKGRIEVPLRFSEGEGVLRYVRGAAPPPFRAPGTERTDVPPRTAARREQGPGGCLRYAFQVHRQAGRETGLYVRRCVLMIDEKTVIEALDKRNRELEKLYPEVERGEREVREIGRHAKGHGGRHQLSAREGRGPCDRGGPMARQMARDFCITKYGKNRRERTAHKHGDMRMHCACEVQCPNCKQFNVTLFYDKRIYGTQEDRDTILDITVGNGKKVGNLYYCEKCGEEVSL